jgi:hypothetical protein
VELVQYPAQEIHAGKLEATRQREQERRLRYRAFLASDASYEIKAGVQRGASNGASAWLAALPVAEHDLCYTSAQWEDVIALRYGQPLRHLPERCGCGARFSEAHGIQCPLGGFPHARHDMVRDFLLALADKAFDNARKEPKLDALTDEEKEELAAKYRTAKLENNPRGDISLWGLLRENQRCFLDVRI